MYFSSIKNAVIDVDGSGNLDLMKNLTAKAKVSDALINNASFYNTIEVMEGERPDHLSQRLYGTPDFHWTFLLLNPQIKNIWDDWPMGSNQLIDYCTNKYQYLAADTDVSLNNKFIIGETVQGQVSGALGKVKEIHVNMGYVTIELTSGTFTITGETISGVDSQDSVACNFIKSQAYAPHHHVDDSTLAWVPRRLAGTSAYSYIDYEEAITEQNRNIKAIRPLHVRSIATQFIAEMSSVVA